MAHSKLYRNFIILQEDERGYSASKEKALSGYAKVEAKGDKCKISFYAQNLKQEDNYSMVLICCKKDLKQLINLGNLNVDSSGKGDTSKEYYVNNIGNLGISYEKISGAAICKISGSEVKAIMHGFMNSEDISENWRKYELVNSSTASYEKSKPLESQNKVVPKDTKVEVVKTIQEENNTEVKNTEVKNTEVKNTKVKNTEVKVETINAEVVKPTIEEHSEKLKLDAYDDIKPAINEDEERCKKKKEEHKEECAEDVIKKLASKLDTYDCDIDLDIKNLTNDVIVYGFIKYKGDNDCMWKKFKIEKKCDRNELEVSQNHKRLEENLNLDKIDFETYEKSINEINNEDEFVIKGSEGKYFEKIAKGFEPYNEKLDDISNCKWYKVNVNSMEDLCNKSDYDKYTLAFYPMINYYPYLSKENYFLLGYKCNKEGELKYIVYAIPGSKDKTEQPYGGKTGFVTWTSEKSRSSGYWLMFYDYKKSSIVVPVK